MLNHLSMLSGLWKLLGRAKEAQGSFSVIFRLATNGGWGTHVCPNNYEEGVNVDRTPAPPTDLEAGSPPASRRAALASSPTTASALPPRPSFRQQPPTRVLRVVPVSNSDRQPGLVRAWLADPRPREGLEGEWIFHERNGDHA